MNLLGQGVSATGDPDEVLVVARPTPLRRFIALGTLNGLGAVTLVMALSQSAAVYGSGLLFVTGGLSLGMAEVIRRSTARGVELTRAALRETDGAIIAQTADVVRVDRGVMAIKPTNGFVFQTRAAERRNWRFGIWWRVGRHVGIGGMLPPPQTKVMADTLAALIQARENT